MDNDDFPSWDDEQDWPDSEPENCAIPCPECGYEIYEDAELCPLCGYFIEDSSSNALADRPGWFVILGLCGILVTILALSGLLSLI